MRFPDLSEWLAWQELLHPNKIELGLDRVATVAQRMGLMRPQHAVITVGGTNGKGSSVALLEAILRSAGYRVGSYTSPHLLRYNERIRIDGEDIDDDSLCLAFERIDQARGDISLSYFEFGTLAALEIFARSRLDVAILEVGLGGRLDAVNIIDPDVALIATIDIDHVSWLGDTRDAIGREKAGIFRPGHPAVCGDPIPPPSIQQEADRIAAPLYTLGRDFHYEAAPGAWRWWSAEHRRDALPYPSLRGAYQVQNAAAVLMVLELLKPRFPVTQNDIRAGLETVRLPGRFQVVSGPVTQIFDVAHNPHGAKALAETLREHPCSGTTHAVFSMLNDKDIVGVISELRDTIKFWHIAGLVTDRGLDVASLEAIFATVGIAPESMHNTVAEARKHALAKATMGDRIVIFGSFYTVAQALGEAEPR